jgi:hypothetical protein
VIQTKAASPVLSTLADFKKSSTQFEAPVEGWPIPTSPAVIENIPPGDWAAVKALAKTNSTQSGVEAYRQVEWLMLERKHA